jgi:hypothetical protein
MVRAKSRERGAFRQARRDFLMDHLATHRIRGARLHRGPPVSEGAARDDRGLSPTVQDPPKNRTRARAQLSAGGSRNAKGLTDQAVRSAR